MRLLPPLIAAASLLAAALALGGCGTAPHKPDSADTAGATSGASGVTVYGTADVGIGRTRR